MEEFRPEASSELDGSKETRFFSVEKTAQNESPTLPASQTMSWGRFFLETLQTILLALVLYFMIDAVVARVRVENISMQPTLQAGEFILVNKLAYRLGDAQRGDIIVFHYPKDPSEDFIKRVIGIPGDSVVIQDGVVKVNNQSLTEDYIAAPPGYAGQWQVPENSLFVLGDNRNQSLDSHSWGFVPDDYVVGRALIIYWPINKMRVLNEPFLVNAAN